MGEMLMQTMIHVAACGQKEPVEWYVQESGYPGQKCKFCGGQKPRNKVILWSPTQEITFPYGAGYVCDNCVPDMQEIAKTDRYYDVLFGPIKN